MGFFDSLLDVAKKVDNKVKEDHMEMQDAYMRGISMSDDELLRNFRRSRSGPMAVKAGYMKAMKERWSPEELRKMQNDGRLR